MGDDEEGERVLGREGAARPGRGGGTALPSQLGNGGRRGGEGRGEAKAPLPSAGNGTQRDLATPLLHPPPPSHPSPGPV